MKKISLIKNVHIDHKWSPIQVLGKYFEVYGQACPITPEARKKKAPFFPKNFLICVDFKNYVFRKPDFAHKNRTRTSGKHQGHVG